MSFSTDDNIELMLNVLAQERERKENPANFNRIKPFNKLPSISDVIIGDMLTDSHAAKIQSINDLSDFMADMEISESQYESLITEEIRCSNLIEGIFSPDDSLRQAWDYLNSKNFLSIKVMEKLSSIVHAVDPGIRRRRHGYKTRIMSKQGVVYTPPDSNAGIKRLLKDLIAVNDRRLSWPAIALMHYQFESIHPFYDGNGRIGRLIMLKQIVGLMDTGTPVLISKVLYDNRAGYYAALNAPRLKNDMPGMLLFFLDAFEQALKETIQHLDGREPDDGYDSSWYEEE